MKAKLLSTLGTVSNIKITFYFLLQSYEDNEEIMGMTECQVPLEATDFQPSAGEETQIEAKEFVQNTTRAAKPSTPIPKSFCSIDDDDDDSYNPFQVCIHSFDNFFITLICN